MSTAETPKRRGRPPKVKEAPAPTPPPQGEMVVPIPLMELHPFPNHPFKVRDDEAMKETTESVKEYGVLTPAIVRPREKGGYEIVAGHCYTLFSAARDIYAEGSGVALADFANNEVVDTLAFSLIVNALLVARYGPAVLEIKERSRR